MITHPNVPCLKYLDPLVVAAAAAAAKLILHLHHHPSMASILTAQTTILHAVVFLASLYAYYLIALAFGLYRRRRLMTARDRAEAVAKATTIWTAGLLSLSLLSPGLESPVFLLLLWPLSTLMIAPAHILAAGGWSRLRPCLERPRRVLIVGTNPRAVSFARELAAARGPQLRIGFVDDPWGGMARFESSGFALVSDLRGLADYLGSHAVHEVAMYLPLASHYAEWTRLTGLCTGHGVKLRLNADSLGLDHARWVREGDGRPCLAADPGAGESWARGAKRAFDLLLAALAVLILAPLLGAAAIAVRLSSSGPILSAEERVGLHRRRFRAYRFRATAGEAERAHSRAGRRRARRAVWGRAGSERSDATRLTPVGRFLRRSSIDELPQLINVLRGEMSLVGPRPLAVGDCEGFQQEWVRRRHTVRPGMTCLWQVNDRNSIAADQRMLLDLEYMDKWSLWLDLKILARTVSAALRGLRRPGLGALFSRKESVHGRWFHAAWGRPSGGRSRLPQRDADSRVPPGFAPGFPPGPAPRPAAGPVPAPAGPVRPVGAWPL